MFDTFRVTPRSTGLVAYLQADRMAGESGGAEEATGAAGDEFAEDAHLADGDGADTGQDGADGDDPARAAAGDDDDEDIDTDEDPNADPRETAKKLKNALKRVKNKLHKTSADRQLLKQLRDRGYRLEDLYADSRQLRTLMGEAQRNPRLKALIHGNGGDDDAQPRGRGADRRSEPTEDDFQFDESPEALGFDPKESKANRVLADGLKRVARLEHQLEKTLRDLNPRELRTRVDTIDRSLRYQSQTQLDNEWNTAYAAAVQHIKDPDLKRAFGDLMLAAKREQGGKQPARTFVNHYLKLLKVNPTQAARANSAVAASRNRVADRVAQLPRQNHGANNSTPAPARTGKERLADVHKRIRALGR
jgi:hypothetical protein